MIKAVLIIKCWYCGNEEAIEEMFEDSIVDINLNKFCPKCNHGWMLKKELVFQKSMLPILRYCFLNETEPDASRNISAVSSPPANSPKMF